MAHFRPLHDRILVNVLVGLRAGLRSSGSPCDVFTADIAVIVPSGNVRRPDVTIGCPPFDERGTSVDQPRLVVEVLSDSTQSVDQLVKLDEYRAIAGLNYVRRSVRAHGAVLHERINLACIAIINPFRQISFSSSNKTRSSKCNWQKPRTPRF